MPTRPTATVEETRTALQGLALAAATTPRLVRNSARRKWLQRAIAKAVEVLNADMATPPCRECLRRAAAEADAERAMQPDYRRDLDG